MKVPDRKYFKMIFQSIFILGFCHVEMSFSWILSFAFLGILLEVLMVSFIIKIKKNTEKMFSGCVGAI